MEAIKKAVGFKDINSSLDAQTHFFLSKPLEIFKFLGSIFWHGGPALFLLSLSVWNFPFKTSASSYPGWLLGLTSLGHFGLEIKFWLYHIGW